MSQGFQDLWEDHADSIREDDLVLLTDHAYVGLPEEDDATQPPPPEGIPDLQTAHRTHILTCIPVPKSARGQWARILANTIWEVIRHPSLPSSWVLLLILAHCILPVCRVGFSISHGQDIISRIRRWREGDVAGLLKESLSGLRCAPRRKHR